MFLNMIHRVEVRLKNAKPIRNMSDKANILESAGDQPETQSVTVSTEVGADIPVVKSDSVAVGAVADVPVEKKSVSFSQEVIDKATPFDDKSSANKHKNRKKKRANKAKRMQEAQAKKDHAKTEDVKIDAESTSMVDEVEINDFIAIRRGRMVFLMLGRPDVTPDQKGELLNLYTKKALLLEYYNYTDSMILGFVVKNLSGSWGKFFSGIIYPTRDDNVVIFKKKYSSTLKLLKLSLSDDMKFGYHRSCTNVLADLSSAIPYTLSPSHSTKLAAATDELPSSYNCVTFQIKTKGEDKEITYIHSAELFGHISVTSCFALSVKDTDHQVTEYVTVSFFGPEVNITSQSGILLSSNNVRPGLVRYIFRTTEAALPELVAELLPFKLNFGKREKAKYPHWDSLLVEKTVTKPTVLAVVTFLTPGMDMWRNFMIKSTHDLKFLLGFFKCDKLVILDADFEFSIDSITKLYSESPAKEIIVQAIVDP